MTLGVRAVVLDADDRVFLVRHSYVTGWYLPGGGVELGETMERRCGASSRRRGRSISPAMPSLHGMFFNSHVSRRDHVAVYVVRQFKQDRLPVRQPRDCRVRFFAVTALPEGTTPGTRLRIAEVLDDRPPIATWR